MRALASKLRIPAAATTRWIPPPPRPITTEAKYKPPQPQKPAAPNTAAEENAPSLHEMLTFEQVRAHAKRQYWIMLCYQLAGTVAGTVAGTCTGLGMVFYVLSYASNPDE